MKQNTETNQFTIIMELSLSSSAANCTATQELTSIL
jgi:hypothetical protein